MRLLIQCATVAFVVVTTCVATTISCVIAECGAATVVGLKTAGMLLSPGLLLMSAMYRQTHATLADSLFAQVAALTPAILIDVAIYTAAFFGMAKLGKSLVMKGAVSRTPTTNDKRPTTVL